MTKIVQKITAEIKALPREQFDEFLVWLTDYELGQADAWDKEMERDSQPGGRLQAVIGRVREDIAAGRTKPLDQILNHP